MSVRPIDIAAHLRLSKQLVNGYINRGMPTDTLENAAAWYHARKVSRGSDVGAQAITTRDGPIDIRIAKQEVAVEKAYRTYLKHLDEESKETSKSYATYDKAMKMLLLLTREKQASDLASKKTIDANLVIATISKVFLPLRADLLQHATLTAPKANPENPGLAMKVIDEAIEKILRRASGSLDDAVAAMTNPESQASDVPPPEPIVITEPDEEQPDV